MTIHFDGVVSVKKYSLNTRRRENIGYSKFKKTQNYEEGYLRIKKGGKVAK